VEQPERRALSAAELPRLGETGQLQAEDLPQLGALQDYEEAEQ